MNEDLTENERHEVWLIACSLGIDTSRARAEWERRRALNKAQPEPQPEEDCQEVEPEEEPEPSQQEINEAFFRTEQEDTIREKKLEILEKIEKQLDEEQTTTDLTKYIESNPTLEKITRTYLSIVLGFSDFPDIDRAVIVIQRNNGKIDFSWKLLDKDGKDILFDENGKVVKVLETQKPQ